jgi:histidinol phosphatase-like PHP family hydrolase
MGKTSLMKIDLHVHTKERSECAHASEDEQVLAAVAAGLDAIVITDHHKFVPLARLDELNRQYAPFRILSGIEVTVEGEDFIVLGLRDPELERQDWRYRDFHPWVQSRGGYMAWAHPYRYKSNLYELLEQLIPHAIEVHSPNTSPDDESRIRELAAHLGVPLLSNSDAHTPERLGRYYNILDVIPQTEGDLVALLKSGRYELYADLVGASA